MKEFQAKIISATKWSSLAEVAAKIILPIVNMILARILTPESFGIVATITMVITFAEVFQDAGFQKYIVQHEFKNEKDFDESANVAFWSNLFLSICLWAIIILFHNHIASFIGEKTLGLEIIVASVSLPIFALSSIQIAYYRRNLEFKKLFWVRIITAMIPLAVTVPLAIIFRNHWALIIGTVARNFAQAIILYAGVKWKPRRFFSVKKLKEMFSFCIWTLCESITIWITANISILIVTRILGLEMVGYFKTSMSTVSSIISIVSSATVTVLFAALSRVQNDSKEFEKIFFNYQAVIGMIVIPMGFGMYVYRELITRIMLGEQWLICADFIGIYSLVNSFAIVTNSFFSEVYRAKGKPKISMIAQILYLMMLIPLTYIAANISFEALCLATSFGVLYFSGIHFLIIRFIFKLNIGIMVKNFVLILFPTIIMAGAGLFFKTVSESFIWQFFSIGCCIVVYFIVVANIKPLCAILKISGLTAAIYEKTINKVANRKKG